MILYDLAGADEDLRFSPYCWRTRLALAHKGLGCDTRPWRFTDEDDVVRSGQGLVPVVVDGDEVVHDSWRIACHLEVRHPDRPSLFGGERGRAHALFVNHWYEHTIRPLLPRMLVLAVLGLVHERDRDYFRDSRERRFGGRVLEDVAIPLEEGRRMLGQALAPVREVLRSQAWLGGGGPSYVDHIAFGGLQQGRVLGVELLTDDDAVLRDWRERMLDAYGGVARGARVVARSSTLHGSRDGNAPRSGRETGGAV